MTSRNGWVVAAMLLLAPLGAAAQMPNPYGPAVGVEAARRAADAAVAEGRKNGWIVAAAVVEPGGTLVFFEKMDGTQLGSAQAAIDKARSRRPSSVRPRRSRTPSPEGAPASWRCRARCRWRAGSPSWWRGR